MNPFQTTGYISPQYFCNRIPETETLLSNVKNGRNSVLYGWRRLGKSALLWHVIYKLKKAKYQCIYIDLFGTKTMEQANKMMSQAVVEQGLKKTKITEKISRLLGQLGASLTFDPYTAMPKVNFNVNASTEQSGEQNLQTLVSYLDQEYSNVVIVIDEFQQIISYKEGINPEAIFRSVMQRFPKVRFVFSGSHRHLMLSIFSDQNKPFYRSCELMDVLPISMEHYHPFIARWMKKAGVAIDKATTQQIYDWANGQTYYVQLVCNKLYGLQLPITTSLLRKVFSDCVQQDAPYFQSIHELLTLRQKQLIQSIAREKLVGSPTGQQFLKKHNLSSPSSVRRTLSSLEDKHLVIKDTNGYRLQDTLLAHWYCSF